MIAEPVTLAIAYLREQSEVTEIVDDRIADTHPDDTSQPWLKLTLIDEPVDTYTPPPHCFTAQIQVDCYGGEDSYQDPAQVSLLSRITRGVLARMDETDHEDAIVSRVTFGGRGYVPDTELGSPQGRPRFRFDTFVRLHPKPGG